MIQFTHTPFRRRMALIAPMLLLAASVSVALVLSLGVKPAHAGNWNVAVGVSGGNYRPIAYGPVYGPAFAPYGAWGNAWNVGWGGGWSNAWGYSAYPFYPSYVYSPPPAVYVQPVLTQPIVLAAQPQVPVWYFCASTQQYFPYVDGCAEGWQVKQAAAPSAQPQNLLKRPGTMRSN